MTGPRGRRRVVHFLVLDALAHPEDLLETGLRRREPVLLLQEPVALPLPVGVVGHELDDPVTGFGGVFFRAQPRRDGIFEVASAPLEEPGLDPLAHVVGKAQGSDLVIGTDCLFCATC